MSFDEAQFRRALGAFPTGVTVITTRSASGSPVGITANSFSSVSLAPPIVSWSLRLNSTNLEAFEAADKFAISVLGSAQKDIAARFASKRPDKFETDGIGSGLDGIPVIEGAVAVFECEKVQRVEVGDHVVFFGGVRRFTTENSATPLIFSRGNYVDAP